MSQLYYNMSSKILTLHLKNSTNVEYEWFANTYYQNGHVLDTLLDPDYMGDTGFDIHCPQSIIVPAKSISFKIPLGLHISAHIIHYSGMDINKKTPSSFELWPRSSCGSKTPLRLSNSIGLIDKQYRGEIIAIVDNLSEQDYHIEQGDRLFQLVAPGHLPILSMVLDKDQQLDKTERGEKGFGSTGK